jgi:NAD-dependent SIR2 family protein deacetylase
LEENKIYKNSNYEYKNKIIKKIINENPEKKIISQNIDSIKKCKELLNFSESVENYFYCGNIMYYTYREI